MRKSISNLLSLYKLLLNQGAKKTIQYIVCRTLVKISDFWYDKHFGISTSPRINSAKLGIANNNCKGYQASSYLDLKIIMNYLSIKKNDVFLDYGSGMGRVVIVAATHVFHKVIGIEFSSELNAIAKKNLLSANDKLKCKNIQLIEADASSYPIPPNVNIIFLYNPFVDEIMLQVINNIRQSIEDSPRRLLLIYNNPVEKKQLYNKFENSGLSLMKRFEFLSGFIFESNVIIFELAKK